MLIGRQGAHHGAALLGNSVVNVYRNHGTIRAFDESLTIVRINVLRRVVTRRLTEATSVDAIRAVVHQVFHVTQVLGGLRCDLRRESCQRSGLSEAVTVRGVERVDDEIFERVERDVELGGNFANCIGHGFSASRPSLVIR